MKRNFLFVALVAILCSCNEPNTGFVCRTNKNIAFWSNTEIAFQTSMATSKDQSSPDVFDVFIKTNEGKKIHMPIDGMGLGYGASAPTDRALIFKPKEGVEKAEILSKSSDKMVIHLQYGAWNVMNEPITLDKQITLYKDSPIMSVIDYYKGPFELLNVAAGVFTAMDGTVTEIENGYSVQLPYDGPTAIIVMQQAERMSLNNLYFSAAMFKGVASDEPLRYYVGLSYKGQEYLLEELAKVQ